MAEFDPKYASRGVANAGLTTGIVGSALGAMSSGVLPNLFGGTRSVNSEDMPVNRYDAAKDARIAALETEVKLRDANTYTMGEINKVRDYVDKKFDRIEHELCDQKVYNATNTGAISCIQSQIAQLMSLTKLVIPNSSVCPGWGNVTVTPEAASTT